jgi:hypothetical protein
MSNARMKAHELPTKNSATQKLKNDSMKLVQLSINSKELENNNNNNNNVKEKKQKENQSQSSSSSSSYNCHTSNISIMDTTTNIRTNHHQAGGGHINSGSLINHELDDLNSFQIPAPPTISSSSSSSSVVGIISEKSGGGGGGGGGGCIDGGKNINKYAKTPNTNNNSASGGGGNERRYHPHSNNVLALPLDNMKKLQVQLEVIQNSARKLEKQAKLTKELERKYNI